MITTRSLGELQTRRNAFTWARSRKPVSGCDSKSQPRKLALTPVINSRDLLPRNRPVRFIGIKSESSVSAILQTIRNAPSSLGGTVRKERILRDSQVTLTRLLKQARNRNLPMNCSLASVPITSSVSAPRRRECWRNRFHKLINFVPSVTDSTMQSQVRLSTRTIQLHAIAL